jgi:CSLREA domain-containing protein
LALVLLTLGPLAGLPQVARADAAFVVTVNVDSSDPTPDGACYDGVIEGCSLREAIQEANAAAGTKTITFSSGIAGQTINLAATYGMLIVSGSNITVDGGSNAITISGQNLAAGQNVFQIQGNSNTLRNLTVRDAPQDGVQVGDFAGVGAGNNNVIEQLNLLDNGASGVYVYGSSDGGRSNTIQNNVIGAAWSATDCTAGQGNGADGIHVGQLANNTKIYTNRLVCNGANGIWLHGLSGSPSGLDVTGNSIGTNGTADMGNTWAGIRDEQATGTQIASNTISGNAQDGIALSGSSSVTLTNNYIGTNSAGTAALPNDFCGVWITDGAHHNMVGGFAAGERNVISGNGWSGVCLDSDATQNTVEGNRIGVNASGTAAIPNTLAGVAVFSNNNYIGTSAAGVVQIISGNTREGVYVQSSSGNFVGQTNEIGVASDLSTPLGNGLQGVMLNGASNTRVYATTIAYNGGAGVAVTGASATGNRIEPVIVRSNRGLPIDLGNDGPTANDTGDGDSGPNGLLNYPVITGASGSNISGTVCNNCTVLIYQAFSNPAAAGGGGQYPTSVTANASGAWNATLTGGRTAASVTLRARDASNNTSEMSPRPQIFLPLVLKNYH